MIIKEQISRNTQFRFHLLYLVKDSRVLPAKSVLDIINKSKVSTVAVLLKDISKGKTTESALKEIRAVVRNLIYTYKKLMNSM